MSRTVTAMFDSREEAENARIRLTQARIDADRVRIIDQSHSSGGSGGSGEGEGFWSSIKSAFMPDEDGHAYEEGMRRGGYLLCAQVEDDEEQEAMRLLDQDGTVDFNQRQQEWRQSGWQGYQGQSGIGGGSQTGTTQTGQTRETGRTVEEERIPIVEEELRVGKRQVASGGARVRSYVREVPVHEQVTLREEHVSVERRPVNETLGRGALDQNADMLRDRTVEMTEHSEEAVVGKEARVREELVVRKTAEEHVEQIDDTVRRTEVDVDENVQQGGDRSAFSSFGGERIANDGERTHGQNPQGSDRDRERMGSTGSGSSGGSGYSPEIDKSGL